MIAGTFATTQGGSITIAADGSYTYTPAANFNGIDSRSTTRSRTAALTDTGTLTITVNAVNDAPVAVDDAVTATEDAVFNSAIDLDANDTDHGWRCSSVDCCRHFCHHARRQHYDCSGWQLHLYAGGELQRYRLRLTTRSPMVALTDVGTLTITVNAVNDAPVAVDDAVTATEDTVFNSAIDLDANDTDHRWRSRSPSLPAPLPRSQGGSITIAADGSYTYTPAANFNGIDTVDYTVTDGASDGCRYPDDHRQCRLMMRRSQMDDAVTATEDTVFNSAIDLDANDTDHRWRCR